MHFGPSSTPYSQAYFMGNSGTGPIEAYWHQNLRLLRFPSPPSSMEVLRSSSRR
ncbi:hypothetical protein M413DRAFT_379582 [Hebeloma cylindrosporum]|uniref:Uncharacterized protein n=1 Tax=Hebeloma cylindrosporum TaxID=76867 RepID=A0A0C2YTK7_HEBCY|nr:hypothetical protein M413DRAFT_379582 [Hebeloma cylindrosporum h7]